MVAASVAQLAGATVPQLQAILQQPNMNPNPAAACTAMQQYKQQNPAETPADIIRWMGTPADKCATARRMKTLTSLQRPAFPPHHSDRMETTHTCHGNCWRPGHVLH